MHRRWDVAWKLETWDRQLHISIGKFYDGIEQWRRQRSYTQLLQGLIEAIDYRLIDEPIVFAGDGRVFLELRLGVSRRQTCKIRRSVFPSPVQNRGATKNNRGAFRARPEQHRQDAENHIVADDDIRRVVPQHLP